MTQALQLVHALPGRVRVRLPRLKGHPALADEVERVLTAMTGIEHVEASTTTGTVLVLYKPGIVEALDAGAVGPLLELADRLGLSCEHVTPDDLQDWLQAAANGVHGATPTPLESHMAGWFGSLYASLPQGTGGWGELRTLVPLTLAFLGLRNLLFTEHLPFPTWYDYLWFAFSSYMVLHATSPAARVSPAS
jgi:hypothetical protein